MRGDVQSPPALTRQDAMFQSAPRRDYAGRPNIRRRGSPFSTVFFFNPRPAVIMRGDRSSPVIAVTSQFMVSIRAPQ